MQEEVKEEKIETLITRAENDLNQIKDKHERDGRNIFARIAKWFGHGQWHEQMEEDLIRKLEDLVGEAKNLEYTDRLENFYRENLRCFARHFSYYYAFKKSRKVAISDDEKNFIPKKDSYFIIAWKTYNIIEAGNIPGFLKPSNFVVLLKKLETLQLTLKEKEVEVEKLNAKMAELKRMQKKEIAELDEKHLENTTAMFEHAIEESAKNVISEKKKWRKEKNLLTKQIKELKNKMLQLENALKLKSKAIQSLEVKMSKLKQEGEKKDKKIQALNQEIKRKDDVILSLEIEIKGAKKERDQAKKERDQANKRIDQAEKERDQANKRIDKLYALVTSNSNFIAQLNREQKTSSDPEEKPSDAIKNEVKPTSSDDLAASEARDNSSISEQSQCDENINILPLRL